LFLLWRDKEKYDEVRERIKKISVYVGSAASIVLVLLVVFLIVTVGTFLPFLVFKKFTGDYEGVGGVSYIVYIKAEKNNSSFQVQVPIPGDEIILKNLGPYNTSYKNLSNYNVLKHSITDSGYGRVLDISSDGNLTLVASFTYQQKTQWNPELTTQKNLSKVWVYLNRSDLNNGVSVMVVFSGRYGGGWGASTHIFKSISFYPIHSYNYKDNCLDIIQRNHPQKLSDGWNEYSTFTGTYEV
jgi:hypothetical protein